MKAFLACGFLVDRWFSKVRASPMIHVSFLVILVHVPVEVCSFVVFGFYFVLCCRELETGG